MKKVNIIPVKHIGEDSGLCFVSYADGTRYLKTEECKDFRKFRTSIGMSLTEATNALEISVVEISDLEKGKSITDWAMAKYWLLKTKRENDEQNIKR